MSALRALVQYARARDRAREADRDRCELCGARLESRHRHVIDVERRAVRCACRPCALLFEPKGAAEGRYRAVPERVLRDPDFVLTDRAWKALGVPVGLAFFRFHSSSDQWIAMFPSPAGAAEAELDDAAWRGVAAGTRLATLAQPDVEAIFAYRARGETAGECYLAPVDLCFELVARLRSVWTGIQGGPDVTREIEAFVDRLRVRSRDIGPSEQAPTGGDR